METISGKKQSGSSHLVAMLIITVAIIGAIGYFFWNNILQPQTAQHQRGSFQSVSGWKLYSDRYVPIAFEHPQEWQVKSDHGTTTQMLFYAFTGNDLTKETLILEISYLKRYPNLNPNQSKAIAAGLSLKPKCPYDAKEKASSPDCKLVSSGITSGYMYSSKGRDNKNVVRWYGTYGNERLDIESYVLNESEFSLVIKSLRSSATWTGREALISKNNLSASDHTENDRNSQIIDSAVQDLRSQKCDEIKGISYQEDPYDANKVKIYEEWQTLVRCRESVKGALKTHKEAILQGDDCSKIKRFPNLRRILENVKVLSARDGRVALVETSSGNKSVSYVEKHYESTYPWFVDNTCQSQSMHHLKAGDVISVYVPIDDKSSNAYENNTRVVQKVNSFQ